MREHAQLSAGSESRLFVPGRGVLRASLKVGAVGDAYEREADEAADQVMRTPGPLVQRASCACGGMCGHCDGADQTAEHGQHTAPQGPSLRTDTGTHGDMVAPSIVDDALRSPGLPLDDRSRSFFESRFGQDFSGVRVHSDDRSSDAARSIGARAFTVGSDVVFGRGEYSPGSQDSQRLLAHELAHTMQQAGAPTAGTARRQAAAPAARPPRRTVWLNVGFDSSAQANEVTMGRLRTSIATERAALTSCCTAHSIGCNIDLKTRFDWNRVDKPAPADGDYDNDDAADRTRRDTNLGNIRGHAGGLNVLVTESTLSQTWEGARIFPRANTGASGVLWNRSLAADDTLAHEAGHAAGYTGDVEGDAHSSDPGNLMASGSIRTAGAVPDANWCTQMAGTAQ